jgi:ribosome-interacting GTPase 1
MASTNQSPIYQKAEENYLNAKKDEDKLKYLEEMIRECPKHKSAENMLANLKNRYRKLQDRIESKKKNTGKSGAKKESIKKQDAQAIIVGLKNSGKSCLFRRLISRSSANEVFEGYYSTPTTNPDLGTANYEGTKIHLVDMPPFPNTDLSAINIADTLLVAVTSLEELNDLEQNYLKKSAGKRIIILTKADLLTEEQRRKIQAQLQSKKRNFFLFSCLSTTNPELQELKKKIFESFPILRIYLKEPHKTPSQTPVLLKETSTIEDIAEKILKGLSKKIKRAKIWGPSSKFAGQVVGLDHELKDKDIVEFQTT